MDTTGEGPPAAEAKVSNVLDDPDVVSIYHAAKQTRCDLSTLRYIVRETDEIPVIAELPRGKQTTTYISLKAAEAAIESRREVERARAERNAQIVALYVGGESGPKIAHRCGVHHATVYDVLRTNDIECEPVPLKAPPEKIYLTAAATKERLNKDSVLAEYHAGRFPLEVDVVEHPMLGGPGVEAGFLVDSEEFCNWVQSLPTCEYVYADGRRCSERAVGPSGGCWRHGSALLSQGTKRPPEVRKKISETKQAYPKPRPDTTERQQLYWDTGKGNSLLDYQDPETGEYHFRGSTRRRFKGKWNLQKSAHKARSSKGKKTAQKVAARASHLSTKYKPYDREFRLKIVDALIDEFVPYVYDKDGNGNSTKVLRSNGERDRRSPFYRRAYEQIMVALKRAKREGFAADEIDWLLPRPRNDGIAGDEID